MPKFVIDFSNNKYTCSYLGENLITGSHEVDTIPDSVSDLITVFEKKIKSQSDKDGIEEIMSIDPDNITLELTGVDMNLYSLIKEIIKRSIHNLHSEVNQLHN